MFGLAFDLFARVVFSDGAEVKEKRVELAVGERCSAEESDDEERTEKRGCGGWG